MLLHNNRFNHTKNKIVKEIVIPGRNVIEKEEVTVRAETENKIDLVVLRLVLVTIYLLGIILDRDNI
jgi:hypothetical protein